MNKLLIPFLFIVCLFFTSCNDDEPEFSSAQIQQALFEMKGTYHGKVEVAYYHGSQITELPEAIAVSRDSLSFTMSLIPMAGIIPDESIAARLREIGEVTVKAGYDFLQMDDYDFYFVLVPVDVVVPGGLGAPPSVKIVCAQNYGGDATSYSNFMMFNVSPIELWVNGEKYEDFERLVYHFRGNYE